MTVEELIRQHRDQKLIELGYTTRIYRPWSSDEDEEDEDDFDEEYPHFDPERHQHYRLVAAEVTDEQFQRIIAIGGRRTTATQNTLAATLTVLAWVAFILFCLGGLVLAMAGYRNEFDFSVFLIGVGAGFASLLSLLWFAEVLKLLQRIHDKL